MATGVKGLCESMIWTCLKCGLVLDKYSRPHWPKPTFDEVKVRRAQLLLLGNWSNLEDMPKSIRTVNQEVCWGTVVNTPKYNKPVR